MFSSDSGVVCTGSSQGHTLYSECCCHHSLWKVAPHHRHGGTSYKVWSRACTSLTIHFCISLTWNPRHPPTTVTVWFGWLRVSLNVPSVTSYQLTFSFVCTPHLEYVVSLSAFPSKSHHFVHFIRALGHAGGWRAPYRTVALWWFPMVAAISSRLWTRLLELDFPSWLR